MTKEKSSNVVINTLNIPADEVGIDDGDINPDIELTNLDTENPSVWFTLSHRVRKGWQIGLTREELVWLLAKMDENKVP